jgi:hypothetical protein
MATRHRGHPLLEKGFLIAFGIVFLLIAALYPLARELDAEADALKPLYHDVQEMAVLQFREVRSEGAPLPITVGPEETVQVGGSDFTTAEGVSVEVRLDGVGYCVRGRNDDGHVTMWQCYDGTVDPSPRGFSF